jgi:hypothetical protein
VPRVRAPVGVDHDGARDAFQTRTDGQRETHVADHQVGSDASDQFAVLLDISSNHVGRKGRRASVQVCQELFARHGPKLTG